MLERYRYSGAAPRRIHAALRRSSRPAHFNSCGRGPWARLGTGSLVFRAGDHRTQSRGPAGGAHPYWHPDEPVPPARLIVSRTRRPTSPPPPGGHRRLSPAQPSLSFCGSESAILTVRLSSRDRDTRGLTATATRPSRRGIQAHRRLTISRRWGQGPGLGRRIRSGWQSDCGGLPASRILSAESGSLRFGLARARRPALVQPISRAVGALAALGLQNCFGSESILSIDALLHMPTTLSASDSPARPWPSFAPVNLQACRTSECPEETRTWAEEIQETRGRNWTEETRNWAEETRNWAEIGRGIGPSSPNSLSLGPRLLPRGLTGRAPR